jgi:flagellin
VTGLQGPFNKNSNDRNIMSDISLTAAIRSNLVSLQKTQGQLEQTTSRLATGKKVATAVDNPTNFFAATNLNDRASGLEARLDGMGQAIQTIKSADNGITALRGVLSQMKGVVNDALANSNSTSRAELGKQFNTLIQQASNLVKDSGYAGVNLIQGQSDGTEAQSITVQFNELNTESELKVQGFSINASTAALSAGGEITAGNTGNTAVALGISIDGVTTGIKSAATGASADGFEVSFSADGYTASISTLVSSIESFDEKLKTEASKLANNLAIITQREEFTNNQVNVLKEGADKLTLADLNEEGANLLALQTASTLGVQALSLASQQSQQVLRIVG